ncbi:MAG: helix-turn-helix domain-containing protein [Bacillota bacterium]
MSLGQRLKEARTKKGLTQDEAAKRLGITFQALSNYERDVRDPDTTLLKNMAELYSVSTDYLLDLPFIPIVLREDSGEALNTVYAALAEDHELLAFWDELVKRDDLQIMLKQVKDLSPEAIRRIIRYIKIVEDEEVQE